MINPSEVLATGNKEMDFAGSILLYMIDQTGYGDVSLAVKIAKFLLKKYPHSALRIVGEKRSFKKITEIDSDFLGYQNVDFIDRDNAVKLSQDLYDETKLEIETAIFDNSLSHNKSSTQHPKIFIGEYGLYEKCPYKPPIISLSGNIGKNYPGILIEPDLKQFSRLKPPEKTKLRGKIIMGMKDLLLRSQIWAGWEGNSTEFIQQNSFAFSYYNFPISYKRAAVVYAASNDKPHANYFVSASHQNNKDKVVFEMLTDDSFREELTKLGYSKIVFYTENSETPQNTMVLNKLNPDNRVFRIFHRERFQHDVTLDLMRLSDICGVAGDQSLTEAISLGAIPIPEEWHCQINVVDQIAINYYNKTIMAEVYNDTWRRQRGTDIGLWVKAGKVIREYRDEATTVITKIQEEANLYHALEYRLNLEFSQIQQAKITEYNELFIKELEKYTSSLKKDKYIAFLIATEIARYNAKYKPHEPLLMSNILLAIETRIGEKFSHIDSIKNFVVGEDYARLIRDSKSHSFLKHIIHLPSGNTQLVNKLKKLHQHFFVGDERGADEAIKPKA
ncbi:hypothetical protein Lmac_0805 [Legionella maceachernii]|uniref:Uncharacterized protein n=2 Tax=Legionella maceachernii TaxID=466 RepID=A0A0W0WBM5_9GAMM|nr:hypothetical protein [Legionella maceachernii]KTD29630.1 hypothetical protein Lmac_0805 [Legionella maceachernii]SKA20568.1 hypothetical protein SAMN02745128_02546 [Legionella maceachernii]SUP02691.1 Uncharacterised protein [Legionella maceachernii]